MPDRVRRAYVVLALVYALLLLALVLAPLKPDPLWNYLDRRFGIPYSERYELLLDTAVNVLLFVPVGFLLHGWWRGSSSPSRPIAVRALGVAAALAIALEALQWVLGWRVASLGDALANVAGAATGVGLERLLRRG